MRVLAKNLYYPALVAMIVAAYLLLLPFFSGERTPLLVLLLSGLSVVIVHVSERLWPYRASWQVPRGDSLSDFVFTNIVLPVLSKLAEVTLFWGIYLLLSDSLRQSFAGLWPREWPLLAQLVLALVVCEFFFYWAHRWGHQLEVLWKFHSIHHSVERVYWDNSGRFHPVDLFLNWILYFLPLVLFAVPVELMGFFLVVNAITGLLEHANVDFEAGALNRVFNTAQLHRWHHSVNPEISSKNFGKVLSIWDQVFGTYYLPRGEHVGDVGVTTENIPREAAGQMLHPFRELARARVRRRDP